MMPTSKEVRRKIVEKKKKEKEEIQILTQENEDFRKPLFCPSCGAKIERK